MSATSGDRSSRSEIVVLSQQGLVGASRHLAKASQYEAEDVLVDAVGADRIVFGAEDSDVALRWRRRLGRVARSVRPAVTLPPLGQSSVELDGDYRVAIALVGTVWDVTLLETVRELRERADAVVLWVFELWPSGVVSELKHSPFHLVDLVLVGTTPEAAEALDDLITPPVHFMPAGIDIDVFAPTDAQRARCIDLLNIGRRDPVFHHRFLERARSEDWYYFFDSTSGAHLDDHRQHRWLLAKHYQATKLAITSAAKFDLVESGQHTLRAVPGRVFEALAAGAILVGSPTPSTENQMLQVGEVVVHELPDDAEAAVEQVERLLVLDHDEERQHNIELARRRHDWSDRWLRVFELLGQDAPQEVHRRLERVTNAVPRPSDASGQ